MLLNLNRRKPVSQSVQQFLDAIKSRHFEDVESLMIDESVTDWFLGRKHEVTTPLHLAASCGSVNWDPDSGMLTFYTGKDEVEHARLFQRDYLDIVEYVIANGADVNAVANMCFKRTPLHDAAAIGGLTVVECLVSHGADVNKSDEDGLTPLHLAAEGDHLDVVEYLVSKGADVSALSKKHGMAHDLAAYRDHFNVVQYLISNGADVNSTNGDGGRSPLHSAAKYGRLDWVKYLIARGADVNQSDNNGYRPIDSAGAEGHLDVVEYLIASGTNLNFNDDTADIPLISAACYGRLAVVQCLLSHGVNVNESKKGKYTFGWTALHYAAEGGHSDVVECLISNGANISASSSKLGMPLHRAALNGHLRVVDYLIAHGADVNAVAIDDGKNEYVYGGLRYCVGQTPLQCAAKHGHLDVVECLLLHGADGNLKGHEERTLLHYAPIYDRMDIVENAIKSAGNDCVRRADKHGRTAMHFAAAVGNIDVFEYLLENGGDIFKADEHGRTLLHYAAGNANLDIVKYLTKHNADLNALDMGGFAPIHFAINCPPKTLIDGTVINSVAVVQHLIDCGANFEVKTKSCNGSRGGYYNHVCKQDETLRYFVWDFYCDRKSWNGSCYSSTGMKPAHLACVFENVAVLQILLLSGCMMNAKDDDGHTPDQVRSNIWGKHDNHDNECHQLLAMHKEIRRETEFKIFHLKSFSIICRQFRIFDFTSVAKIIQNFVHPMKRPVVFCDFIIDKRHFPPPLTIVPLLSEQFTYEEFVVVNAQDDYPVVESLIVSLREWDIQCHCDGFGTTSERTVRLEIASVAASQWKNRLRVSLNLFEEGSFPVEETIHMLLPETTSVAAMKITFIDFMKLLFSTKIRATFTNDTSGDLRKTLMTEKFPSSESSDHCIGLVEKLLAVRVRLFIFYDSNHHKLLSDDLLKNAEFGQEGCIIVHQKRRQSMTLVYSTPDGIESFVCQESLLIRSVTGDRPSMGLLRKDYRNAGCIRQVISKITGNACRIILLSSKGLIDDDTSIDDMGEVVDYAAVERYDDTHENVRKLQTCLGQGGYGKVFECRVGECSDKFVLKELTFTNEKEMLGIVKEILVASRVGIHPRVMKYIRFLEDQQVSTFYIMMDRMKPSLTTFIKDNNPLRHSRIAHFTKQILEGVAYLHDHKVAHRDIKSPNILLDQNDDIRLTDFGLSKCLDDISSGKAQVAGMQSDVGTYNWMAPEITENAGYGLKSDVWSVGATMVEMITGRVPFFGFPQIKIILLLNVEKKIPFEYPDTFHEGLKQIVESCLTENPLLRPNCKELLSNAIFKQEF